MGAYGNNNPHKHIDPDGRNAVYIAKFTFRVSWQVGKEISSAYEQVYGVSIGVAVWNAINNEGDDSSNGSTGNEGSRKPPNPDGQNGESVLENRKVRGHDSNRRPDVQIVNEEGNTRKIFEAERKPNSNRNVVREREYDRLGIPHETHGLK